MPQFRVWEGELNTANLRFYSKFKIWVYWFVITVVNVQLIKTQKVREMKPIDWLENFFMSTFRITHFFKLVIPPSSHLLKVTAKVQSHRIKNWLFRYWSWHCCICFITVALFSFVKNIYINVFVYLEKHCYYLWFILQYKPIFRRSIDSGSSFYFIITCISSNELFLSTLKIIWNAISSFRMIP